MAAGSGTERVLQRIRRQIESGSYYEAQQSYKTVFHRYKAKNMIKESYKVLEEGACLLLEKEQTNCGIELGNLLLEAFLENRVEVSEESISGFRRMMYLLPRPEVGERNLSHNSAEVEEAYRFLDNLIRWLKKKDTFSAWYMEFNSFAGEYLHSWKGELGLGRITLYFSRGRSWNGLTKVLSASIESGNDAEEDLFLCRAVMQILFYAATQPVQGAATFLKCYGEQKRIPQTPLINFTYFLIEALQIPSERLVSTLATQYASAINRDKHLGHLLKKLQGKFFAGSRSDNPLMRLFDGLLGESSRAG